MAVTSDEIDAYFGSETFCKKMCERWNSYNNIMCFSYDNEQDDAMSSTLKRSVVETYVRGKRSIIQYEWLSEKIGANPEDVLDFIVDFCICFEAQHHKYASLDEFAKSNKIDLAARC